MESYASALCNFKITKLLKTTTCYTNSLTFSAEKSQATSRNLGPVFLPKYIILTTHEKCFKESFFSRLEEDICCILKLKLRNTKQ